ncbi:hypothetical protein JCM30197_06170 [Schleiferia thermophila]|nr:hypothetical protein JCM30197_06170 [Schleiferia thermophila]
MYAGVLPDVKGGEMKAEGFDLAEECIYFFPVNGEKVSLEDLSDFFQVGGELLWGVVVAVVVTIDGGLDAQFD